MPHPRLILPVLLLSLAACASAPRADDYARFGGQPGLDALVEDLLARSLEDPRIQRHFVDVDLVNLHARLVEQFCAELGGPCTYRGRSMAESHAAMGITEGEFNALVEHLIDAMQAQGVPRAARNRLLARLAPMHADIVSP